MRLTARLLIASAAVVSTFAITQTASAESLDACGDFFFDPVGDVECTVEVEGGCEAACTPVSFEVGCAAELQIDCDGGCNVDIEVGCDVDCEADCNLDCDPGTFDCNVECSAGCEANCDAECSGSSNSGECHASCSANCSASCSGSCEASPPSCEGGCQAKCEGECKAEASASCQIDCQAEGYVDCKAEFQGGCEVACEEPSGAVFCNGQWVNTDDLDSCVDAIIARFDIEVSGYAEASCDGNSCEAEAGVEAGCSAAPGNSDAHIGFMMLGLGIAGAAVARRRNRKA